ncbi:uncharacterized protein LOC130589458 [Beta vulgaris subsp. vulgaris]|uniref:uncharacterized protein LOC130589458 n=1 Tax=Beta vulgaris subsp. vulgaris TaxID=3555 RepID=UPI0025480E7C|nr:uncharacterized protein LOC130589458 [Beta vulgaris subsp. vulgaris]
MLKRFYLDQAHPLSSPMVVRSLDVDKDPFRPREINEEILGPEQGLAHVQLEGIGMNKTCTSLPQGTKDMGLFFSNQPKEDLIGFADAGYLSDPHNARSQTGYVFTSGGTAISWRSMKQTIAATSSNHAEILAIHEASRECVWLRSVIQHIREDCGISIGKEAPTVMYEDNAACIAQLKEGYIKGDRTKHILPKFSSPMNCRRMVMYRFYRFVQVKIWQTYLPRHFPPLLSRN